MGLTVGVLALPRQRGLWQDGLHGLRALCPESEPAAPRASQGCGGSWVLRGPWDWRAETPRWLYYRVYTCLYLYGYLYFYLYLYLCLHFYLYLHLYLYLY